MKTPLQVFLSGMLISSAILTADIDLSDTSSEKITAAEPEKEEAGPISVQVFFDIVSTTRFDEDCFKSHIDYSQAEIDFGLVYYYEPCYEEGLNATAAFNVTNFKWHDNPFFNQTRYNTLTLTLGGFTRRVVDWRWVAQAGANLDTTHWDFEEYTTYDMLLWGRYNYCDNLGVHVGFVARSGMKIDRVLPILGVDWTFWNCMQLNLIFPLNVSLAYSWNKNWSAALAGRFFYSRHRVGDDQHIQKGLWEYQNTGAEFAITYLQKGWLSCNVHAGYALGGRVKISDRHHKHSHRFDFEGSPYAGLNAEVRF